MNNLNDDIKKYKKRENLKKLYMLLEENHIKYEKNVTKKDQYLSKEDLAIKLDVDIRTIERYINFFITKHNIKIQSQYKKGYFLIEKYTGPPLWKDELYDDEVIMALILSERISTAIPDETIKKTIKKTIDGLYKSVNWDPKELEGKISLKNSKYSRPDSKYFLEIINALKLSYKLKIKYQAINQKDSSEREICPLHLLLYLGNWMIIAYCELRKDLRFFKLSRIYEITPLTENQFNWIEMDNNFKVKEKINESYGIFVSDHKQQVELKFDEKIQGIVENLVWTPEQEMVKVEGNIIVKFFVADYREIKNDILSYGESVEVIKPLELREIVKKSIKKMTTLYRI